MNEIRVMHLISGGDTGGAKTHVINLINGLNEQVFTLLVTLMESDFTKDAEKLKLPLHMLNQKYRIDLTVLKSIYSLIENNMINIIHVHGARANFIATFIKKKYPFIPIVTTVHSDYLLDDYRGGKFVTNIFRKINERALRKIEYFVGVSDNFKNMMIERGFGNERKVFAVYNGIDFSEKNFIIQNKNDFFNKYNIEYDVDKIYVGIMGRMDPVKDQYTFLKAAKYVVEHSDKIEFLLAGDGSLRKSLESFSEKNAINHKVHFLGYVDKPFDFYNAIDINVLTSLSESFPYVMLEGARMHKPMISTMVGGVEKVIKNNETGFATKIGDYQMIGEKILILANDDLLRGQMGEKIYKVVSEKYSQNNFIERHIEIYKKILEDD